MMQYFKKRRIRKVNEASGSQAFQDNDPMTGVANLFDLGLVFMVGLILVLFSVYNLQGMFSKTSEFTIVKKDTRTKELEIITKKGKKIKAMKVTRSKIMGRGVRLGTAYRLEDGTMVYVPE